MCVFVICGVASLRTMGDGLLRCVAEGLCSRGSGGGCFCAAQVKGKRLDTDSGIRTRSRAATQREQYEAVPAPVQIFVLLADMLIEAREGARPEWNLMCSCAKQLNTWQGPSQTKCWRQSTKAVTTFWIVKHGGVCCNTYV